MRRRRRSMGRRVGVKSEDKGKDQDGYGGIGWMD